MVCPGLLTPTLRRLRCDVGPFLSVSLTPQLTSIFLNFRAVRSRCAQRVCTWALTQGEYEILRDNDLSDEIEEEQRAGESASFPWWGHGCPSPLPAVRRFSPHRHFLDGGWSPDFPALEDALAGWLVTPQTGAPPCIPAAPSGTFQVGRSKLDFGLCLPNRGFGKYCLSEPSAVVPIPTTVASWMVQYQGLRTMYLITSKCTCWRRDGRV